MTWLLPYQLQGFLPQNVLKYINEKQQHWIIFQTATIPEQKLSFFRIPMGNPQLLF